MSFNDNKNGTCWMKSCLAECPAYVRKGNVVISVRAGIPTPLTYFSPLSKSLRRQERRKEERKEKRQEKRQEKRKNNARTHI